MTVKKLQKKAKLRNAEYFGLQEVLDRLYAQSAENKRFTVLMELVAADENILLAYRNISKNKGSKTAGTDGKTVRYLSKFTNTALIHYIKRRLEQYQPQPVRRVEIPKGDTGKTRPLGIPTIADRLIQQCFLQILEPICEAKFHERSNGFRPNRSAEHALAQCYAMIQKRGLHDVGDSVIKGFFDHVSHGKLLKQMWNIHCHHKLPREKGGNDQYGNLVLVTETVHILIHATDSEVIARLVQTLRLNTRQRAKLNTLRKIAGLFSI